ncbi:MAG: hypothetical protein HOP02_02085 [Methylococcaceae bacterium]|nr:hypothetical protein [Methylococcaceae bacterium]
MNIMNMPGFTAEASLHTANRNYRAIAATFTALRAGALTLATRKNGKLEWIDCNDFPANNFCRECGNTGPDAAICCPDDYCAVIDKNPLAGGQDWGLYGVLGRMISARR